MSLQYAVVVSLWHAESNNWIFTLKLCRSVVCIFSFSWRQQFISKSILISDWFEKWFYSQLDSSEGLHLGALIGLHDDLVFLLFLFCLTKAQVSKKYNVDQVWWKHHLDCTNVLNMYAHCFCNWGGWVVVVGCLPEVLLVTRWRLSQHASLHPLPFSYQTEPHS